MYKNRIKLSKQVFDGVVGNKNLYKKINNFTFFSTLSFTLFLFNFQIKLKTV